MHLTSLNSYEHEKPITINWAAVSFHTLLGREILGKALAISAIKLELKVSLNYPNLK
jgi:hypothetical protein